MIRLDSISKQNGHQILFIEASAALNRGEKIELRGFGSFRLRERDARRGRNPKTGEPVDIPAKRVPYFKPGKELKEFFTDGDGQDAAAEAKEPASDGGDSSATPS